jgi:hypothetical protein
MTVIQDEMTKLAKQMQEFASVCDHEFNRLLQNVDLIQQGQRRLNAFKFDEPLDMGKYRKK